MSKNEIKVTVKAKNKTFNFDNVREFCDYFNFKENAVYKWLSLNKDKNERAMFTEKIKVIFDRGEK